MPRTASPATRGAAAAEITTAATEATASTAEEVYQNWEQLKKQEKPRDSILDGVPVSLPALASSQSIQGRARRVGFDRPDIEGPLDKLREEIGEFARAADAGERADEFGDILFVLVNIADHLGVTKPVAATIGADWVGFNK